MAKFFPCPNPACTYQFDAEQLPAAAMVTCPICRTRFPYKANASKGNASKSRPAPVEDDQDDFRDEDESPRSRSREKTSRLVSSRNVPKGSTKKTILMIAGFVGVGICVILVIVLAMRKKQFNLEEQEEFFNNDEYNFRFQLFAKKKWNENKALSDKLGTNGFLQKRSDPDAWIGLRALKYEGGTRNPRPRELEVELQGILSRNFGNPPKNPVTVKLANVDVPGYHFEGELDGTLMEGEGYMLFSKGIGYIMLVFAPKDKWSDVKDDLFKLRDTFKFGKERDNWKEKTASSVVYTPKVGDYQMEDMDGIWEHAIPEPDPADPTAKKPKKNEYVREVTDEDDNATMLFRCPHPGQLKKARPDIVADAMVLSLEKGEGVDDAKNYLTEKLNKRDETSGTKYTFEPQEKPPFGTALPKSEGMAVYWVTNTTDPKVKSFYVISTIKSGDRLIAAVAWCKHINAELLEPYLIHLVGTLKAK
ncbi:MAG: zinc-ribbon domain-containing protein [Planctomycetes bacterium]|nr:zinc-ribbon domain-containing protein [Planctomycetota bacterium]